MDPESRLRAAGIDPDQVTDAEKAWERFCTHHGTKVTVMDRYAIEALARGGEVADLSAAERNELAQEVLAIQFPGIELIGESSGHPVEVVPYDAFWQERFNEWHRRLGSALGATAHRIEHVGSTAVPGLAAKPIVDIQISVADVAAEDAYRAAIEGTGVLLRSRELDHRYFRPSAGEPRLVHIHVCQAGDVWERDHLLFRDYLRSDDPTRDRYAQLKLELAAMYRNDRLAYTDGKAEFVYETLAKAGRWARATRWEP